MATKGGISEIAKRYAIALFDLGKEQSQLDDIAKDLRLLAGAIEQSADLRTLLQSPVISRGDQGRAMEALMGKLGVAALTQKFIGYLASQRRLFALPAMIDAFLQALAADRGEVRAAVTAAVKLSAAQVKAIEAALKKAVGGDVVVDHKIDPSLIGGLVVRVDSRMIDFSVATQLRKLKLAMKGA